MPCISRILAKFAFRPLRWLAPSPCSRSRCSSSCGLNFQLAGAPSIPGVVDVRATSLEVLGERLAETGAELGVGVSVVAGDGARVDEEDPSADESPKGGEFDVNEPDWP
mmetsp:Transcript_113772/g.179027  ORF Transcript_113772/g.179027 Transcript_113772/m.179027 type:complete len:109 (+) Transcript_113772:165-491(+)